MKATNPLLEAFPNYVQLWEQLDREYRRTPGWRWIRQARLLSRMHKLNKRYERWFNQWLKNSDSQ